MQYNPKHQVKVDGKMNEHDAGKVGNKLANAALIASILFGVAALVADASMWL